MYGYFVDGSVSLVNWANYLPDWGVDFIPNIEAEIGLSLSILGSIPVYYVEFAKSRVR